MSRRLLVVACAAIYLFLMLPLVVVFPISLSSAPYMQFPPPGLSTQWYERYLDDPQWIDATWRSLYIGGATAVLALGLGVPLAFALARVRFAGRALLDRLALAPLIVPTIILSVGLYGLFAKLKLIGEWYGLVAAHTVLALPFVVLVTVAGLRDFDRALEQAADSVLEIGEILREEVTEARLVQILDDRARGRIEAAADKPAARKARLSPPSLSVSTSDPKPLLRMYNPPIGPAGYKKTDDVVTTSEPQPITPSA